MQITLARTEADLQGILTLQQKNLTKNLPADIQSQQGFVTVEHDPDVLRKMNEAAPHVIAKDGDTVVGYAITMLSQFGESVPELVPLFARLDSLEYNGRSLGSQRYYVMGQICVGEGYRGQGIFDKLYQFHRETYSDRFDVFVTDISERNTRSQRAHERVGFRPISRFYDENLNETWIIVVWDWTL
ncbi:GNAT family N-acetyltransferase [Arsenicibacter rosenii]|uniref:GNAT family N-acetyltransferase n=1 Tax=Arsenicibacter rosenii TaxID=1750698 RepID=A0A1S2VIY7_9BACT|nr:GNAT family N-acetyltransferase [Arsenicibacter rosenii]OIN58721.1 GNAT family N-acetyltransferase [Arsenicibacter rosenii]